MVCGTCGQPADKSGGQSTGINTVSSGSSSSSVTVTRTYRSIGDSGSMGLGDSLMTRTYLLGNSSPRRQVSAARRRQLQAVPALPRFHPVPASPFLNKAPLQGSLPLLPSMSPAGPKRGPSAAPEPPSCRRALAPAPPGAALRCRGARFIGRSFCPRLAANSPVPDGSAGPTELPALGGVGESWGHPQALGAVGIQPVPPPPSRHSRWGVTRGCY